MSNSELHNEAIVALAHEQISNEFVQGRLSGDKNVFERVYAPRLREGGVNIINLVVGRGHTARIVDSASDFHFWETNKNLDLLLSEEEEGGAAFILCRGAKDIDKAIASDKIGILATIAGGRPLEGKPNLNLLSSLRNLYRLGLRGVQLTGNGRNRLGDGAAQARSGGGLTLFGIEVVQEMERLGMVIDVAQLNDYGFYDVLEHTNAALLDSHSNAREICDHARNLSDERIKAMAERNSVIGLSFYAELVNKDSGRPTLDDLLKHVDHIANLVGVDHIALGSDYSGFGKSPAQRERHAGWIEGLYYGNRESDYIDGPDEVSKFGLITQAFVQHGYSNEDIQKILGGNFLRLYRQALG